MVRRLNGWQRLWVLVSVVTIFPVVYVAVDGFNYSEQKLIKELRELNQEAIRRNDEKVVSKIEEKLKEIEESHNYKMATSISKSLAWWLVFSVVIYILGASISWVRNGFHTNQ